MPTQPLTPQNIPLENIALNPYRTRRPNPARVIEGCLSQTVQITFCAPSSPLS